MVICFEFGWPIVRLELMLVALSILTRPQLNRVISGF